MSFSMSKASLPALEIGLNALSGVLDKMQALATAKKIDAAEGREITFPLGPEHKGHMLGEDYLNHFLLPNVYFHLTAAYAILRHCGADLGKRDFLGAIPMRMT